MDRELMQCLWQIENSLDWITAWLFCLFFFKDMK